MHPTSLKLPPDLRKEFKRPWGVLLSNDDPTNPPENQAKTLYHATNPTLLISVGDVCTDSLWKVGLYPHVVIVDGITLRGSYTIKTKPRIKYEEVRVKNPPATIMKQAWEQICMAVNHAIQHARYTLISVIGEEDLLTLPSITCCPTDSVVTYGQPKEGMVWITVTPKLKLKVQHVLSRFEQL